MKLVTRECQNVRPRERTRTSASVCIRAALPPRLHESSSEPDAHLDDDLSTTRGWAKPPWGMAPISIGRAERTWPHPEAVAHGTPVPSRWDEAATCDVEEVAGGVGSANSAAVLQTTARCFSKVARVKILVNRSAGFSVPGI
jgi:hypothetical protein